MGIISPVDGTRQNSALCSAVVRSRVIQAGGGYYLSRILFENWVQQKSDLFKLFLSNNFSNSKKLIAN